MPYVEKKEYDFAEKIKYHMEICTSPQEIQLPWPLGKL
jgi:hypothetical protein